MQSPGEQLFTVELAEVWSSAERRRGEFLAVWFCGLRDRLRAASRRQQVALESKFENLERRLPAYMELRQGA
jgi:hypothetical protein